MIMATCNDCIHKDICYLIEHYGRDLCSNDACDKFLATPVVHGHWINENFYTHCSVCNNMAIYDKYGQEVESDYCPRCGAKMDGNKVE